MKITNLSTSDLQGGAAIAAFRLNEALNFLGHDSVMLVADRISDSSKVTLPEKSITRTKLKKNLYAFFNNRIINKIVTYGTWSYAQYGFDLSNNEYVRDSDVLILHWINGGFLSNNGINKLIKSGKKIIWQLHDMWPMTGGCHHSMNCDRYKQLCDNCPMLLQSRDGLGHKQLKRKLDLIGDSNLIISCPSEWIANKARESALFKGKKIIHVPNPLNTNLFSPANKKECRELLGLPTDKKLILIGAESFRSQYKGFPILKQLLSYIKSNNINIVSFGDSNLDFSAYQTPIVHSFGKLRDAYSLKALYNACDVFVTPSVAENFPNVLAEASACGLPSVGFDIGGIPEIIQHTQTGYISKLIDAKGLLEGIYWVLDNPQYQALKRNARLWATSTVSYDKLKLDL